MYLHLPRNWRYFNPRTCEGVRPYGQESAQWTRQFQSTHPVRGATIREAIANHVEFQSTHPVRGATPSASHRRGTEKFSIHAPREGVRPQEWNFISQNMDTPRIPRHQLYPHDSPAFSLICESAESICRADHSLLSYQTTRRTHTVLRSHELWCERPSAHESSKAHPADSARRTPLQSAECRMPMRRQSIITPSTGKCRWSS